MKHLLPIAALLVAWPADAQHSHDAHADMNTRGAHAMGFPQDSTTHHFLLQRTGGTIRVVVKDPADAPTAQQIRGHLAHIRQAFAVGDFALPLFIHETMPPGADVMKARRQQLQFRYHDLPTGGEVVITTGDEEALKAIHAFLRFQILEHRTGDPLEPQ